MQWTLVTGGAKRLGAEICRRLAKQGHAVIVHYNKSQNEALQVVEACRQYGVEAECLQGDFSTQESTQNFIMKYLDKYSQTKYLINNVGNYIIKSALDTSPNEWQELFQTNLHTPIQLIQALMPAFQKHQGHIINIGVVGIQNVISDTRSTAFTMSKMALWMLTKTLAAQYASAHIRVNMVSPGLLDNAVDLKKILPLVPMGRAGTLEEVSNVIAFLLDPSTQYITGQNIEVAGGLRLA